MPDRGSFIAPAISASGGAVANIAALALLSGMTSGSVVRINTLGCLWTAVPSGTSTVDGITYVAGVGVDWQRIVGSSDAKWLSQSTWWISDSGSVDNDGLTSGTAIHPDELQLRLGDLALFLNNTTINFSSALDHLRLSASGISPTITVTLVATTSVLATSSVSTWTTPNVTYANQEVALLTAVGITDWTPYVGKALNFGSNVWGRVAAVSPEGVGITVARVSKPINITTGAVVTPTPGQAFTIESLLGTIGDLSLVIPKPCSYTVSTAKVTNNATIFSYASTSESPVTFANCDISGRTPRGTSMLGGTINAAGQALTGTYSCVLVLSSGSSVSCVENSQFTDCLFQATALFISGCKVSATNLAIFDVPLSGTAPAINVNFAELYVTGYFMGKNTAYIGLVVYENASVYWVNSPSFLDYPPTIKGVNGDWTELNTGMYMPVTWANTPYRCFNQWAGTATLTAGTPSTAHVNFEQLRGDAILQPTHVTTGTGTPGTLSIANRTLSGFDIVSTSTTDANQVAWSLFIQQAAPGGVFQRGFTS
jgi:hypothetical protein